MSDLLRFETNAGQLGVAVEGLGENLTRASYALARETFRDIRDLLMESVRDKMLAQDFVPLTQTTREYKVREGLDPRMLFASGSSFAGIDGMYGATFAKALRGQQEWYLFLHDKGRGYGPWSREGWGRTKEGARKAGWKRRHREDAPAVPGVTYFPQRQVFVITPDTEESILARYDLFLQTACDEVGS